jgi:hypothetical protein
MSINSCYLIHYSYFLFSFFHLNVYYSDCNIVWIVVAETFIFFFFLFSKFLNVVQLFFCLSLLSLHSFPRRSMFYTLALSSHLTAISSHFLMAWHIWMTHLKQWPLQGQEVTWTLTDYTSFKCYPQGAWLLVQRWPVLGIRVRYSCIF